MYEGYLALGGGEVLNSARSVGYTTTVDCPVNWLVCPPCDGIPDALGHNPYHYDNISEAPWYDEQDEPTHRFLGAHGISFEGIPDSTREAEVAEGILDGGVVGRVRNATRRIRVRAMLSALGEDALEVGFSWLNSALTPGRCGLHGDACGAADARFYAACPPTQAEITTPVPVWNEPLTNLVLNPSMETSLPEAVIYTNLATNPSLETAGSATAVLQATNLITNPSFETLAAPVTVRTNLYPTPGPGHPWTNINGTKTELADGQQFDIPTEITHTNWVILSGQNVVVPPNSPFIAEMEVEVPAGYPAVSLYWQHENSPTHLEGDPVTINPGEKKRVGLNPGTVWGTSDGNRLALRVGPGGVPAGARFIVRKMLAENAGVIRPYFDGSTLNAGDWTYAWTGATNGSTSIQMAPGVVGYEVGQGSTYVLSSQEWSSNRARSLRVITKGASNSFAKVNPHPLVAGKTYTAQAVIRQDAVHAGTQNPEFSRQIYIEYELPGTGYQKVHTPLPPNGPGVYPVSVTFTIPADANQGSIGLRLYVGSNVAGEEVWFDDFLVVEGAYTGPYFDGEGAHLRRNVGINPLSVGPDGFRPNSGDWSVTKNFLMSSNPAPQGIDRAARSTRVGADNRGVLSMFNVDGVSEGGGEAPQRWSGAWVYVTGPDYSVSFYGEGNPFTPLPLAEDTWTWVTTAMPVAAGRHLMAIIEKPVGQVAPTSDVGYITGVTSSTEGPPADAVWGGRTGDLLGAWEGTADDSPSYLVDPAYTYAWTGTPDASTSTQTKTIETVAGVTPPAASQASVALTADTPAHGAKAMRYTLLTTGPIDLPIADADLTTGTSYTIYGRVRPRTRSQAFIPRARGASGPTFTASKDNWTEFRATIVAGGASKATTGLYLDPGSGYQVGDIVDIDTVVVTQGAYGGPYFDGSTPNGSGDPDLSYAWTGLPNESTSTISALGVANIATPPADQAKARQTTDSPSFGSHALRYVVQTAPAVGLSATDLLPDTGATYTLVGKVRPRTRDEKLAPRIRAAVGPVFTAPKDVWTSFRLTMAAGSGAVQQTGLLLASNSGHKPGDIIDIDEVLLIEGIYEGPYFDGDFPDSSESDYTIPGTKLREFKWTGTPHASTSEFRTGNVTSVEDPIAYEEKLFRMVRNLHTVTCVAGPTVIQKYHRGDTWGYQVEFVLVAAVPWMYGDTRPVDLAPSIPIVVQDVPFNLVPYPSAELAEGSVIAATNYVKNPSIEANTTDWARGSDGSVIPSSAVVLEKTTELEAHGSASVRAKFTATTSGANGHFYVQTNVPLPDLNDLTRFSANLWATASIESGTAVLGTLDHTIYWLNSANATLREDDINVGPAAGGAFSLKSIAPPPVGTTQAILRAIIRVTSFSSGAVIRLYADAATVSVP